MDTIQDPVVFVLLAASLIIIAIYVRTNDSASEALDPIIIGRQSLASSVYREGESPVYTNANAGGLRPQLRPRKDITGLASAVCAAKGSLGPGSTKSVLAPSTEGPASVSHLVRVVAAGLSVYLEETGIKANGVLVVLSASLDTFIVGLACSLCGLETYVAGEPVSAAGELVSAAGLPVSDLHTVTIVDDAAAPGLKCPHTLNLRHENLVWKGESALYKDAAPAPSGECRLHFWDAPSKSFFPVSDVNVTSSLNAWISLFPESHSHDDRQSLELAPEDVVLVDYSAASLPGFGAALACVFLGASVVFTDGAPLSAAVKQTNVSVAIVKPAGLAAVAAQLEPQLAQSTTTRAALGAKLGLLGTGRLTTGSIADALCLTGMRNEHLFHDLRYVIVGGPVAQDAAGVVRSVLGVPVAASLVHAAALAPLTAQLPWDVALNPAFAQLAPVGPPTIGLELKVAGSVREEARPGRLLVRAPFLVDPSALPATHVLTHARSPNWPEEPGAKPQNPNAALWGRPFGRWYDAGYAVLVGADGVVWAQRD